MRTVWFLLAAAASQASAATPEAHWPTYTNVKYGYSVCFPSAELKPQPEAANGDGRRFVGRGGGLLSVFGANDDDMASRLRDDASAISEPGSRSTYKASGPNWGVISGTRAGRVTYEKAFKSGDQTIMMIISYPETAGDTYKPIVEKLSKCFVAGKAPF